MKVDKKYKYVIIEYSNNGTFYVYLETKKQYKTNERVRKNSKCRMELDDTRHECRIDSNTYIVVKINREKKTKLERDWLSH